jgi:hypothetical protein
MLPKKLQSHIIVIYLFSDIFIQFKSFFMVENSEEIQFLFSIAFGFMPRKFDPEIKDNIIYDEEEPVPEMYFITEG